MQDLIWALTANKMIGGVPKTYFASLVCWNGGIVSRIKEKKNLWYCEHPKCHLILVHSYLVRNVNELESSLGSSSEQLEWWKTYSRETLLKNRNVFNLKKKKETTIIRYRKKCLNIDWVTRKIQAYEKCFDPRIAGSFATAVLGGRGCASLDVSFVKWCLFKKCFGALQYFPYCLICGFPMLMLYWDDENIFCTVCYDSH